MSFKDSRPRPQSEGAPMLHTRSHSVHHSLAEEEARRGSYSFTPGMTRSRSGAFTGQDSPRRHRRTFSDPSRLAITVTPPAPDPPQRSPEKPRDAPAVSRSGVPLFMPCLGRAQRSLQQLLRQLLSLFSRPLLSRPLATRLAAHCSPRDMPAWCSSLDVLGCLRRQSRACLRLIAMALATAALGIALVLAWSRRAPPPARLQRVLLPATLLSGGREDFGAPPVEGGIAHALAQGLGGLAGGIGMQPVGGRAGLVNMALGVPAGKRALRVCLFGASRLADPIDGPVEDADAVLRGLVNVSHALGFNVTVALLRPPRVPNGLASTAAASAGVQSAGPPSDPPPLIRVVDPWAMPSWARGTHLELIHAAPNAPGTPTPAAAARSHQLLEWLDASPGEARCDVAHFIDATAEALYPLVAQRQGLALPRTLLVLHIVSPLLWRLRRDTTPLASTEHAATLHMERLAIRSAHPCRAWPPRLCTGGEERRQPRSRLLPALPALPPAPQLLVPSGYLLAWLRAHGPPPRAHAATLAPPPLTLSGDERAACKAYASPATMTPTPLASASSPIHLIIALDWRSPAEVALVANAITLMQRLWKIHPRSPHSAPWRRLHLHLSGRLASVGPRGGSGYAPAWPLSTSASVKPEATDVEDEDAEGGEGGGGASDSSRFDGRRLILEHAALHEWRVVWTAHGAGSRWLDLHPPTAGSTLLLFPLLSASAPLDVRVATRCRLHWLSIAAAGVPARISASDGSRTTALVGPNATELAVRLDSLLRARDTASWPRPAAALSEEQLHDWWAQWYTALTSQELKPSAAVFTDGADGGASEAGSGAVAASALEASPAAPPPQVRGSSFCERQNGQRTGAQPSVSIVLVVCGRPTSRAATLQLQASLSHALPAAEAAAAALTTRDADRQMLLVVPESRSSCLRRRLGRNATVGGAGARDNGASDGLLEGVEAATLTAWSLVHVKLVGRARCDDLARSGTSRPAAMVLGAIFGRIGRRVRSEYALVLEASTIVQPDVLCALLAAASAPAFTGVPAAGPATAGASTEPAERAFVPATRLWPARTGVRAVGSRPTLALPLGGPMSVGALRNTFGKLALVRVATLRRLWRLEAGVSHGRENGGVTRSGAQRAAARGERCGELIWQLLARASLVGTAIEPVPFALGDALATPVLADGLGGVASTTDCATNRHQDAAAVHAILESRALPSPCVEVMALRPLLSRRVATAGGAIDPNATATARAAPNGGVFVEAASPWAPEALDMASVLEALQRLAAAAHLGTPSLFGASGSRRL